MRKSFYLKGVAQVDKIYDSNVKIKDIYIGDDMINNIIEIKNVGKFEELIANQEIKQNQAIFGFNGTGKSTLSDIFYSLSQSSALPEYRKTLNKDDGTVTGDIHVRIGTNSGEITYKEGVNWDNSYPILTFNSQYVNEFVFIGDSSEYSNTAKLYLGKEGTKLEVERVKLDVDRVESLNKINDFIRTNKDITGNLGMGKAAIKKLDHKNIQNIADTELLNKSQECLEREKLSKLLDQSNELILINKEISKLNDYPSNDELLKAEHINYIQRLVNKIPSVSAKQLNEHMRKYMKINNIEWIIDGYENQSNLDNCPFCGQLLTDKKFIKYLNRINEYIATESRKKTEHLVNDVKNTIYSLHLDTVKSLVLNYFEITENQELLDLLGNVFSNKYSLDKTIVNEMVYSLEQVVEKMWKKIKNPHEKIELTNFEVIKLKELKKFLNKCKYLKQDLLKKRSALENKISKEKVYKEREALIKLSYEGLRDEFFIIKKHAKNILLINKKIPEIENNIKDTYDASKIQFINEILHDSNVKFQIEVEKRNYYIKLHNRERTEYNKDTQICSEGEKRILAFAYFLSEVSRYKGEKTIVLDDPISSMDISRRATVSYKIKQLSEEDNTQIILLTHDLSLIERVQEYTKNKFDLLEMKNKHDVFYKLNLRDYIVNDEAVYQKFITSVTSDSLDIDKVIALASMRPYISIVNVEKYEGIRKRSSYYSHTIYAKNTSKKNNICFNTQDYDNQAICDYIKIVCDSSGLESSHVLLAFGTFNFPGFDYEYIKKCYFEITLDTVDDARKKAILLRVMLEACLFKLSDKTKLDLQRIGSEYDKLINKGSTKEKKLIATKLKELYDHTKKYHHGTDDSSTMGLAYINPDEMEIYDKQITLIIEFIES